MTTCTGNLCVLDLQRIKHVAAERPLLESYFLERCNTLDVFMMLGAPSGLFDLF